MTVNFEEAKACLTTYLTQKKLSKTPARYKILEYIYSLDKPFNAEFLHAQLKDSYRLSLATIYNTLTIFLDSNLIVKYHSLPGHFAVRGDIVDIWSLTEEHPFRIELFGDEIDSIRSFDAESQRSIEELRRVLIYPANDHIGRLGTFMDWISKTEKGANAATSVSVDERSKRRGDKAVHGSANAATAIFIDEPTHIADAAKAVVGFHFLAKCPK